MGLSCEFLLAFRFADTDLVITLTTPSTEYLRANGGSLY